MHGRHTALAKSDQLQQLDQALIGVCGQPGLYTLHLSNTMLIDTLIIRVTCSNILHTYSLSLNFIKYVEHHVITIWIGPQ